ncbi:hypothetical protein LCGC14_1973010, partial [marine sediment metagenome]
MAHFPRKAVTAVALMLGLAGLGAAAVADAALPDLYRLRFDPLSRRFTLRVPAIETKIVHASPFLPDEAQMSCRDRWLSLFEEEYSDRLAASRPPSQIAGGQAMAARAMKNAAAIVPELRKRIARLPKDPASAFDVSQAAYKLETWLTDRHIYVGSPGADPTVAGQLKALGQLADALSQPVGGEKRAAAVRVAPLLVLVERRWQGRDLVGLNYAAFAMGRDIPDVISYSRMSLAALIHEGWALP